MWTCFQHGPKHENYNGFPNHPKVAEASYSGSLGGEAGGIGARWSCLKPQIFLWKILDGKELFLR